jgi:hypothetical protein
LEELAKLTGAIFTGQVNINSSISSIFIGSYNIYPANMGETETIRCTLGKIDTNYGYIGYKWKNHLRDTNYIIFGDTENDHIVKIHLNKTVFQNSISCSSILSALI